MKSVVLLRHAKSDWSTAAETDHERPLARRGRRAAPRMGRFLDRVGATPELAITSSAVRARTTLELAAEAGAWDAPTEVARELYGASPEVVLSLLRSLDDGLSEVLLVGHEPTWSELTSRLTGGSRVKFPTAALVRIDFPVDAWSGLDFGGGTLLWMVTPKLLKRAGLD